MKKIIIVTFLMVSLLARGREYVPLLNLKSSWNVVVLTVNGGLTINYSLGEVVEFNDTTYYKINSILANGSKSLIHLKSSDYEYIREDTIQRKVFARIAEGFHEILLYDFELELGDTLNTGTCSSDLNSFIVQSVDSILLINGEYRKRWLIINKVIGEDDSDIWIEGIGSIKGLLLPGCNGVWDLSSHLLCYHEDDELLFQNSNYDDCVVTLLDVNNSITEEIIIHPNPVEDKIHFQNNTGFIISKVEIYNLEGRLLMSSFADMNQTFDISFLRKGVYIVHVFGENAITSIKQKIIKL